MEIWEILVVFVLSVLGGIKTFMGYRFCLGKEPSLARIWNERLMYMMMVIWLLIFGLIWIKSGRSVFVLRTADLLYTYGILTAVDLKKRIVPDSILLCYTAAQIFAGALTIYPQELLSVAGTGMVVFLLMIAFSYLSKGQMGMGDAKLIGVTAMTAGWVFALQIVILAMGMSFVCSIILLLVFKRGRTEEIPFVPFLTMGLLFNLIHFLK